MNPLRQQMDADRIVRRMSERKLAWSSCNIVTHGLKFFYHHTLKRRELEFQVPAARQPQKLPEILSREEVAAVIGGTKNLKHRVILMTTYAAGLRVSEVGALKVTHIDSARMLIRVEQGKGAKDRYTLLSTRLLEELRRYWRAHRPQSYRFPAARNADQPMNAKSAQRVFYAAKDRAGIGKDCGIHGLRHAFATQFPSGG